MTFTDRNLQTVAQLLADPPGLISAVVGQRRVPRLKAKLGMILGLLDPVAVPVVAVNVVQPLPVPDHHHQCRKAAGVGIHPKRVGGSALGSCCS